jgi:hypothetical protein
MRLNVVGSLSQDRAELGQRLALDYGLAIATAELAWLDHMLNGLTGRQLSTETTSNSQ